MKKTLFQTKLGLFTPYLLTNLFICEDKQIKDEELDYGVARTLYDLRSCRGRR